MLSADTKLDNLSLIPDSSSIEEGESRSGSPAAPAQVTLPQHTGEAPKRRPVLFGCLYLLLINVLQWTSLAASLPILFLIYQAFVFGGWGLAVASLLVAGPLGIVSFCLYVVVAKYLVMPRTRPGTYSVESWFYLRKWFIGNSAMLPMGCPVGDDCLIGCLSLPPAAHPKTPNGTDWLGSPSFSLPHRQKVGDFDPAVTYRPTKKLIFQRCLVDAMRIIFPSVLGIPAASLFLLFVVSSFLTWGAPATIVMAPIVTIVLGLFASLFVVVFKKVLMGTFKPCVHPLWSMFVWLNEAVNGAYESIAAPTFTPMLGTPFFAPYLRLLGCKIGKDVYMETTLFSEFDLVEIGDHVALNAGAVIQNHLFEDRVMKASTLKIDDHCTVGNMAVVLYDTEMEPGAMLDPLSLLMKGEVLPEGTHWSGVPTSRST